MTGSQMPQNNKKLCEFSNQIFKNRPLTDYSRFGENKMLINFKAII